MISSICCLSCLDCEKRKTAAAIATPAMRSMMMVIKAPNEEPPLGTTVAGISEGLWGVDSSGLLVVSSVCWTGRSWISGAGVVVGGKGDSVIGTEAMEGMTSGVSSKAGAEVASSWLLVLGSWIGKEVSMGGVENGSVEI